MTILVSSPGTSGESHIIPTADLASICSLLSCLVGEGRVRIDSMDPKPLNVDAVLSAVTEHWSPRTIATVNDYDVRVVKVHGDFTRHSHPETDEFFFVLSGALTIGMDEGDVRLETGDSYVVPRGRFHRPRAESETTLLLFEPSQTVNTGDTASPLTAERRLA